jgi:Fur family ferric uptake transcriptional regulator
MVRIIGSTSRVRRLLHNAGERVTAQRKLVLELLDKSGTHLDADELYRQAKKKSTRISLSTVYRNLQLFKKLGLIEEQHFDEEHHHYEVKSRTAHQHLVCVRCGRVVEFACPMSQRLRREVGKKYGFDIVGVEVRMTGLCSSCRTRQAGKVDRS